MRTYLSKPPQVLPSPVKSRAPPFKSRQVMRSLPNFGQFMPRLVILTQFPHYSHVYLVLANLAKSFAVNSGRVLSRRAKSCQSFSGSAQSFQVAPGPVKNWQVLSRLVEGRHFVSRLDKSRQVSSMSCLVSSISKFFAYVFPTHVLPSLAIWIQLIANS